MTQRLPLKILNVLVFVFFFGSNIYSVAYPGAHEKISYLTPARYAFYVWTLINALLLGTVVFQFTDAGLESVIEGIGFRFAIIGVLNGLWASLYHHGHYIIAFILIGVLALAISTVYWDMKNRFPPKTTGQALFVSLPFSLWHAYSVFLVCLSGTVAFSQDKHTHVATLGTKALVVILIGFLAFTAVGYAFQSQKGDMAGAAVIAWMLLGVYTNQPHPKVIHWFALTGFIISLLAILKAAFFTARSPSLTDDGERAPLIAGSD